MKIPTRLRLAAAVLAISLAGRESSAQTADDLFRGDVLHDLHIAIDPAAWQTLRANFQSNTYYPCNFAWKDVGLTQIGIRSRGLGSRSGTKPGLRVDFNRYVESQEFLGMKSVILDNGTQDPAFIRERLSMLLFQRLGLPAPQVAHARLFINGKYSGLYGIVESVDKRFLKRWFGENGGILYEYKWKYYYYFTHLGAAPGPYAEIFEPRTFEDAPPDVLFGPLESMIRTLNRAPVEELQTAMSAYLDWKLFLTYVAVENFIAEWDGILGDWGLNNFYLYRLEGRPRFYFIPWDKDYTFKGINTPIFNNAEENALMKKALAVPELRAVYLQALVDAAGSAAEPPAEGNEAAEPPGPGWLEREIAREYEQIREAARSDTLKPFTNQQFEDAIAYLSRFARERGGFVRRQVDGIPKPGSPPPDGIDLGDIAAGGDGAGTASPEVVGIHPDSGRFERTHRNGAIRIADGSPLTPVDDGVSAFIDSVFIIDRARMPISTSGVAFTFPGTDLLDPPGTWDHILKDRIGGEDFPVSIGGAAFQKGVGIHAAAGITYDLEEIRKRHGPQAVGGVRAFAGMGDSPSCAASPGSVTTYLILSSETEVLESASHTASSGGELIELPIPPEARFLTLAAGAGDGRFYCNSGTFADAFITPGAPNPPRNLAAAAGNRRVELSWDEPGPGPQFTGYRVFRDGAKIADLPAAQTNYADEGLLNGNRYCYRVRAIREGAESGDSNPACDTPTDLPVFLRGDCDGDGQVSGMVTDAVFMLSFNFLGETSPRCIAACDADGDGEFQGVVTDAIYLLNFNFLGGPPPAGPYPACGRGTPADAALGCEERPAACP